VLVEEQILEQQVQGQLILAEAEVVLVKLLQVLVEQALAVQV
jgi:hypothetical protein